MRCPTAGIVQAQVETKKGDIGGQCAAENRIALVAFVENTLSLRVPFGLAGINDRIGVTLEQLAADEQHHIVLSNIGAIRMLAKRQRLRPCVDQRNVLEQLAQVRRIGRIAGLRHVSAHIPKLAEITSSLIGWIVIPQ